jgi:hypothetical protein
MWLSEEYETSLSISDRTVEPAHFILGDSKMKNFNVFSNKQIEGAGPVSRAFVELGITSLYAACRYVHELPYGYNSDRDDLMILFKEKMGSCTTKHAVIASLAAELALPIEKAIGIYAMTEEIVAGAGFILDKYKLPYIPMVHCFLVHGHHRVDLTEGNHNGKKRPIDEFLFAKKVIANISAKNEYLLYRKALTDHILKREELNGTDLRRVLHAREEGINLLKANINQ